jgi:hypothetical protein
MSEIFFGSGLEKNGKHATRPPVGEKFNIKTITPSMIAYTATQVSVVTSSGSLSVIQIVFSRLALLLAQLLRGVRMTVYFYLMSSTMLSSSSLSIPEIHGL